MSIIKKIIRKFSTVNTDKEAVKRYEEELKNVSDEELDYIIYKMSDPMYEQYEAALNIKNKREGSK